MAGDVSPHTHVKRNLPRFVNTVPRITLLHSPVDSVFAARLARALLGMYGAGAVRLTDGADQHDAVAMLDDANPDVDTCEFTLAVLSLEAFATPEYAEVLRNANSHLLSAPDEHVFIGVIVREFILPPELAGWRLVLFEDDWRYDVALAELLNGIRSGMEVAALPAITGTPAPDAFDPRVFISHSGADNAFGLDLERRLKAALGDPEAVFYDRDGGLIGGDEWMGRLQHKISDSNVFVLLLSPQAFDSPWVQKELRMALRTAVSSDGKVIIPVLHRETSVWPFLEDYQFVSYVWPRPPDDAFAELLTAVKLGHSRLDEVNRMRLGRPGPPFDVDLLPLPGRFVGRGAAVEWTLEHLDPEMPRQADPGAIASIAAANGLPGIGKSALAGYVARILYATNRFPDGIAVVLCNGLHDPADVLALVLARFDPQGRKPKENGMQALRDLARRTFAGRQALVVLDNVEPEWPVEQVVTPLRVAGTAVLITSRVRLPANVVPPGASRMLELLSPDEALDLFAEYYGRGARQDLTPTEQKQVARIVKALGYHTLAVKLAAARTQGRDLEALAHAYETDPRLGVHLKDGAEAVAVVLASSVAELPEYARTLFAALGAFATGDIGRRALLAIAEGLDDSEPETSVDAIVDLRLVDAYVAPEIPREADRERIRLHPLIQAFAREQFAVWDEASQDEMRSAVAAWYAAYTLSTPDLALIIDEDNIIGVLVYLQEHQAGNSVLDPFIANICAGMCGFWRNTGRMRSGLTYLPLGIAAGERVAANSDESTDHRLLAEIEGIYGDILNESGQGLEAERAYQRDLAIRRQIMDRGGEGTALSRLGDVALRRDSGAAQTYYEQALAIHREVHDRANEGTDLSRLGDVAQQRGELEQAQAYLEQALAIHREGQDRHGEGIDLTRLGTVAQRRGELEQAAAYYEQALTVDRELQNRNEEGIDLSALGDLARKRDELEAAQGYYEQAVTSYREAQNTVNQGIVLTKLGDVARDRGKLEEAQNYYEQALTVDRELRDLTDERIDLSRLGDIALRREQLEKAQGYYERALTIQLEQEDRAAAGNTLVVLGQIAQSRGEMEDAERLFQEALSIAAALDEPGAMASILVTLGNLFYGNERYADAVNAYERATVLAADNAAAWSGLGNALDDLQRHEEAVEAYNRSLALSSDEAIVWRNKAGVLLENLKQFDEALAAAERALTFEPSSIRGWMLKGIALQRLSRDAEARFALEQAVEIDPDSSIGWASRGRALAALARSAEALVAYDEALKFDPEDEEVWELKAESLRALGRENEAQEADAHAHPPDA